MRLSCCWLAALSLALGACGGGATSSVSPTAPTSESVGTGAPARAAVTPPDATASDPIFTVNGPSGCAPLTSISKWILDVSSAGAGFHLTLAVFSDGHANCEETHDRPAPHMIVDGPLDYAANSRGQTIFTYPAESCGRVQVDLAMTTADGKSRLIAGQVLNSGKECLPPPTPTCANTPSLCPPPPTPPPPPSPPPCKHPREHHCPGPKNCHSSSCTRERCHDR